MRPIVILAAVTLLSGAINATAEEQADSMAVADVLSASAVSAEFHLQQHNGQWPPGAYPMKSIREERPFETIGWLMSPTEVIISDFPFHPRFVKEIRARFGSQKVNAKIAGYAIGQVAEFLELAEPLKDAKPLAFDASRKGDYLHVTTGYEEGEWNIRVSPFWQSALLTENGRRVMRVTPYCLIADGAGVPVGMIMRNEMPPDDSWKGSPVDWPKVTEAESQALLAGLEKQTARNLLRVKLNFRSPASTPQSQFSRYRSGSDDESVTEMNVVGALLDDSTILVPANLKAKQTARLERITVYPPEGEPVRGEYICALADYGCFLAKLGRRLEGSLKLAPGKTAAEIVAFTDQLMLAARISIQGEKRVAYFGHDRIRSFEIGWRRNLYPRMDDADDLYLFTLKGELVALSMAKREKVTTDAYSRYGRDDDRVLTTVASMREALADPTSHADPGNAPLSEANENRLAWMGVELQRLDSDLARANNVSDLTRNGETGALVSYIYPDSPAAKAGIETGYVLLRLHVQGQPAPLAVKLEEDRGPFAGEMFPWDKLDQLPEQYFDQLPQPWQSAENEFTRALTDLGLGTKYTAEFFSKGKVIPKDFDVVAGPPHYESAPRFPHKGIGITVRDMTYEVRRYFQRKNDDPGVIISKVDPGSKASVGGIKPYEMITHVNDSPVLNVKDFERLVEGQQELRFTVKRMTRDRVVKIRLAATGEKKD